MAVQLLKKWGNSPAVRIPAAVMESAQLVLNQRVQIRARDGQVIIEPVEPSFSLDDLLARITAKNRHDPVDFGAPQGRELI